MSRFLLALAALAVSALAPSDAFSMVEGKKVALVIGNSAYVHAITLPNPVNDGKLIAETLRGAGFEVLEGTDLNKTDMGNLLDQFTEAAYDADTAVVYYAGHGLQVDGHNYLIPVDAELQKASQLQTRTIPVEDVLNALPPDPAVGIIILDACRDNPLARTLAKALPISRSSTMSGGLAPVQASGVAHDSGGLLIAYATDPGAVAYDGKTTHSPYTTALAKHLTTRGLEIQSALTRVRAEVSEATSGAQRPWHNASLAREVFIGGQTPAATAAAPATPSATSAAATPSTPAGDVDWTVEQKVWDEASKRNTVEHYELYLAQFPNGHFARVAALNIDQLKASGETKVASAETEQTTSAAASAVRTAVSVPDDVKLTPGTPETEQSIDLDKQGRIDLQLRLSALGYETGGFDGALGARSRTAIGKWQKETGIVETTYLTPQQHLFLVVQTDPLMAQVRANYEADRAAAAKRAKQQAAKSTTTKKQTQTATKTTTKKKQQVATRKTGTQTANDDVPYKKRTKTQSSDDSSGVGTFAAGALLGTAIGVAIGKSD